MSVTLFDKYYSDGRDIDADEFRRLMNGTDLLNLTFECGDSTYQCNGRFIADNIECDDHGVNDNIAYDDPINHPSHYTQGQYECIEVMEDVYGPEIVAHFCLCNAFKYTWRTNNKNGLQDMEKARWYSDKYVELMHKIEEKTDA